MSVREVRAFFLLFLTPFRTQVNITNKKKKREHFFILKMSSIRQSQLRNMSSMFEVIFFFIKGRDLMENTILYLKWLNKS